MHEGHRDRMRERILKDGIEGLQPHEVLEYLLYAVVPRKDTNALAHTLIEKFGSLSKVFTADYNALLEVTGMTANAALYLATLPAVFQRYMADLNAQKQRIVTRGDVVKYLTPYFVGEKIEKFYMLCLDAHNNIINLVKVASGLPAQVTIEARTLVEHALKNKAVAIIIAHNHPSGDTTPSHDDIELTRAITVALELVKVKLTDHYIFGDSGYYSFFEDGLVNVISRDVNGFLKEGLKY